MRMIEAFKEKDRAVRPAAKSQLVDVPFLVSSDFFSARVFKEIVERP